MRLKSHKDNFMMVNLHNTTYRKAKTRKEE